MINNRKHLEISNVSVKYTGSSPKESVFYFSFSVSVELYETPPINDFLGIPYSVDHCTKST